MTDFSGEGWEAVALGLYDQEEGEMIDGVSEPNWDDPDSLTFEQMQELKDYQSEEYYKPHYE